MNARHSLVPWVALLTVAIAGGPAATSPSAEEATVSGTMTANGAVVKLPFVYVWALEKGFYEESDPTWRILFVEHAIAERDLDDMVSDTAYVELGITKTAEFGDQPELQVYSQSIKLAADSGGNISGGTYPKLELTSAGPESFAGRVWLPDPMEFFDDTIQYDFTFSAPLSHPNAPVGDPLPAGGGEPGAAYLAWVAAVHSGDLAKIKAMVPAEMAAELDGEDAKAGIEMLAILTPTDVKILGGSSDGKTAVLQVEGMMDTEKVKGEVTLDKMEGHWVASKSSW